jgi:hypothetical protein
LLNEEWTWLGYQYFVDIYWMREIREVIVQEVSGHLSS